MVTLFGPMRSLEVVVLTPATDETWVELNRTHAYTLGVTPPRGHGPLAAGSITIVGPRGRITVTKHVIIEQRHIEITAQQAAEYGVSAGELVHADIGGTRGALLRNVQVRVVEAKEGFGEPTLTPPTVCLRIIDQPREYAPRA
jgi:propanediol utilization protein